MCDNNNHGLGDMSEEPLEANNKDIRKILANLARTWHLTQPSILKIVLTECWNAQILRTVALQKRCVLPFAVHCVMKQVTPSKHTIKPRDSWELEISMTLWCMTLSSLNGVHIQCSYIKYSCAFNLMFECFADYLVFWSEWYHDNYDIIYHCKCLYYSIHMCVHILINNWMLIKLFHTILSVFIDIQNYKILLGVINSVWSQWNLLQSTQHTSNYETATFHKEITTRTWDMTLSWKLGRLGPLWRGDADERLLQLLVQLYWSGYLYAVHPLFPYTSQAFPCKSWNQLECYPG